MKSSFLLVILLTLFQVAQSQKLVSKNGHIWFYSHTAVEDIEAHNRQVVSILDPVTGDFAFNLLVKSFEFKIALMQEHFNENYMESDKYPKSTFKGKITNNASIDYKKDGIYPVDVAGDLTIHNVTQAITVKGTLEIKGQVVVAKAEFIVKPADYKIEIPAVVEKNIAKELEVTIDASYAYN